MSQKAEINEDALRLDAKIRSFCLSQVSRWNEIQTLAKELEDKDELWWTGDCARRGLFPVFQNRNIYVDLGTGQVVTVTPSGLFKASMSDVLSIAGNVERVIALSQLTLLRVLLRRQDKRTKSPLYKGGPHGGTEA